MDFISLLSQYADGYAIIIAVAATQALKLLLPTPTGGSKWDVKGLWYRLLPFIPLLVGVLVVMFRDVWVTPSEDVKGWDEGLIKGLVSGIAASYLYRTIKVSIFGDKNAKNGKNGKKEEPNFPNLSELLPK